MRALQGLVPPNRSNLLCAMRSLRALATVIGPLVLAGLSGCASMENRNPDNLPKHQLSLVAQICQHNIGVWPGTGQFEACVDSLSDSLKGTAEMREKAIARADCISQGKARDTPALAVCILNHGGTNSTQTPGAWGGQASEQRVDIVNVTPYRSFSMDSLKEIRRREKLSCAELGFDPTTGVFDACVVDLEDALIAADRPFDGEMRSPGDSPFWPFW